MWAIKKLNLDWGAASNQRVNDMNELDEFRLKAYESSAFYKENMKKYHDQKIEKREFDMGDLVILYNSRLRLFPGNLKSKWIRPFIITQVFPYGAVELRNKERTMFKVSGQRIKVYLGKEESVQEMVEAYYLDEV
ncbi:hypothetical protein R3W88_033155 [Solanum pinnatisectum]|uniref:Integrase n=1 Tax=Solanum pinnatisectum TaxID=50273 RepID=A0AAV9K302_9SOLN|nr:hypothetical protein R3W88_033155 [Solanum pinnatisectum]